MFGTLKSMPTPCLLIDPKFFGDSLPTRPVQCKRETESAPIYERGTYSEFNICDALLTAIPLQQGRIKTQIP